MSDSLPTESLPLWMQVAGFGTTVILAAIKFADYIRRPELNAHVTRDVFFRLIDDGEALFCSAVLLARTGPVLVKSVRPTLWRLPSNEGQGQTEKVFPLQISQFGEKVHGATVHADHKFFGSSPLQYLAPSKPHRAIYLCFHSEYQERQKRSVTEYIDSIEAFRNQHAGYPTEAPESVRAAFQNLVDEQFHSMANLIQLEAGKYQLRLTVEYECVGFRFFGATKKTESSIEFKIDESGLKRWRNELRKVLSTRGQNALVEKTEEIIYPTLAPLEIRELP